LKRRSNISCNIYEINRIFLKFCGILVYYKGNWNIENGK